MKQNSGNPQSVSLGLKENWIQFTLLVIITGIYPAVWGIGQLGTGKMSDHFSKKKMLFWGMLMQGVTLVLMAWAVNYLQFILLSFALGLGTAIVYPTFLAAVADNTHPGQRAQSIGIFRLWRDLGYAIGALLTGVIADWFGIYAAVLAIGLLTFTTAWIIQVRMRSATQLKLEYSYVD